MSSPPLPAAMAPFLEEQAPDLWSMRAADVRLTEEHAPEVAKGAGASAGGQEHLRDLLQATRHQDDCSLLAGRTHAAWRPANTMDRDRWPGR